MILTVTLNPSLDRTYRLGPLRPGEVHRALADTVEPSGKGVNVALALHRAGVPARALLPLGGPEGEQVRTLLDAAGLPYTAVPVPGATRTNVTLVEPDGRTTKVNSAGSELPEAGYAALARAVAGLAGPGGWVVLAGTAPPGAGPDRTAALLAAARGSGAQVAVDSSGAALATALRAGPDLLAPNAEELAALTGRELPGTGPGLVSAVATVAAGLVAGTGVALLVSLGADGALWVSPGGTAGVLHAVAEPVTPVNTAGAGDALLAGWLAGADPAPVRLARAVAWGTAACLLPGTTGDVATAARRHRVTVTELPPTGPGTGAGVAQ